MCVEHSVWDILMRTHHLYMKPLHFLKNVAGGCYKALTTGPEVTKCQALLMLQEGQSKSECLKAGMLWRRYYESKDIFIRLCCLLLVEKTSVFGPYLSLGGMSTAPLSILFLFCVLLHCLLAYLPQFPKQLQGEALGCLSWRGLHQGLFCQVLSQETWTGTAQHQD